MQKARVGVFGSKNNRRCRWLRWLFVWSVIAGAWTADAWGQNTTGKSELLFTFHLRKIDPLLQVVREFSRKGWVKGIDFAQVDRIVNLLKGRGGRVLGLQWNKGVWLALSAPTKTRPQGPAWFHRYAASWQWERMWDTALGLEVTCKIPVQGSFLLRFALRRLLRASPFPFYEENIGGMQSFWFVARPRFGAVLVLTGQAMLLRLFWKPNPLTSSSQRQLFWSMRLRSMLTIFGSPALRKAEQRLSTAYSGLTQWVSYIRPTPVVRWLDQAGLLHRPVWKRLARRFEGIGLGGWLRSDALRLEEVQWMRPGATPAPPASLAKPMLLPQYIPGKPPFVADITLRDLGTRWPFHKPLGSLALRRQWRQNVHRLWQEQAWGGLQMRLAGQDLAPWTLQALLGGNAVLWFLPPTKTPTKLKILPSSTTRKPDTIALIGQWTPSQQALFQTLISGMKQVSRFGLYGHTPFFVAWEGSDSKLIFSWRNNLWIAASDFAVFHDLCDRIEKGKLGKLMGKLDAQSLLNMRSWGRSWQVVRLTPATLDCCWFGCKANLALWPILQRLNILELASRTTSNKTQIMLRASWQDKPTTKDVISACHGPSSFWRRIALQTLAPFSTTSAWLFGSQLRTPNQ